MVSTFVATSASIATAISSLFANAQGTIEDIAANSSSQVQKVANSSSGQIKDLPKKAADGLNDAADGIRYLDDTYSDTLSSGPIASEIGDYKIPYVAKVEDLPDRFAGHLDNAADNLRAADDRYLTPLSSGDLPADFASSGSLSHLSPERIAQWDALAGCESGGDWHINTGNGYYGGIQFNKQSWDAAKGGTGADNIDYPHQASREQQILAGENLLDMQGWGAWPACSSQLGFR